MAGIVAAAKGRHLRAGQRLYAHFLEVLHLHSHFLDLAALCHSYVLSYYNYFLILAYLPAVLTGLVKEVRWMVFCYLEREMRWVFFCYLESEMPLGCLFSLDWDLLALCLCLECELVSICCWVIGKRMFGLLWLCLYMRSLWFIFKLVLNHKVNT